MKKPYLLSVGLGLPLFGIWGHRYVAVKRKHTLRSLKFLGIHVLWTTYARSLGPP